MYNNTSRKLKLKCGCIVEITVNKKLKKQSRKFVHTCYKHAYNSDGARR